MPKLVVTSGPLTGTSFEVEAELTIGRENATIVLPDEEASRRHAVIRLDPDGVVIEDEGSLNGTWVDERRIEGAARLRGGEVIRVGDTTLTLEADPVPEPDAGATRVRERPDRGATVQRAAPASLVRNETDVRRRPPAGPPADPPPEPTREREPVVTAETRLSVADAGAPAIEPVYEPSAASQAAHRAPRFVRGDERIALPFGALAQPAAPRRRGIATRKPGPTLLSFTTIIASALGLVIYFLDRA